MQQHPFETRQALDDAGAIRVARHHVVEEPFLGILPESVRDDPRPGAGQFAQLTRALLEVRLVIAMIGTIDGRYDLENRVTVMAGGTRSGWR